MNADKCALRSFMHDLLFRANLDAIAAAAGRRGFELDVEAFRALDAERRAAVTESEQLKAERNAERRKSANCARQAWTPRRQQRVRDMDERMSSGRTGQKRWTKNFATMLAGVPNIPHESVPAGKSAEDNVEVRRWGTAAAVSISSRKPTGISAPNWAFSISNAPRKSPARGLPSIGALGAKLERALINFMLDVHTREHGYTEVLPPFMINSASLFGTGQLPKFAEPICSSARARISGSRPPPKCQ